MKISKQEQFNRFFAYLILIIGGLIVLFPFVWMILTSLKTLDEAMASEPNFFPKIFMFSNYKEAFEMAPFSIYFINSVMVAVLSTICVLFTTILAAFAFSKYDFKGKKIIFTIFIATLMIPGELLIITNFKTITTLGLYDSWFALFFPYIGSIFYIFLVQQFFISIPHELYLTSKVDGCSDFRYLFKILVPISRPILITVSMLNIIASWNAFLWPLLVTSTKEARTLPIGLVQFTTEAGSQFHLLMAASTMIIIPMIVLFIISRKYIVSGLTSGSIKG
ncbi:MAG: carbohydrate ABC transporter permease [Mycoplasmatales bacterium]